MHVTKSMLPILRKSAPRFVAPKVSPLRSVPASAFIVSSKRTSFCGSPSLSLRLAPNPLALAAGTRRFSLGSSWAVMPVASSQQPFRPRLHSTEAVERAKHEEMSKQFHRGSTRYHATTRADLIELESIPEPQPHHQPSSMSDRVALKSVKTLRKLSDLYFKDRLLDRACMLETIAAVPGLVAGMVHHLRALRRMKHCTWIKPTMDEAENERMHLMTFMELTKPSSFQTLLVVIGQGVFMTVYFPLYMLFPRTCHRFVGYLEEEACHTYSEMLKMVDEGKIENVPAPKVAIKYWGLPEDASLRDVILVVRADEADHRLVNHYMGDMSDHFHTGGLEKPCDRFHVDLDRRMQTAEEKATPGGGYMAELGKMLSSAIMYFRTPDHSVDIYQSSVVSSSVAMALTLHGLNCSTPNFNASFVRATEDSKNQCSLT
eukprot:g27064.t1